MSGSRLRNGAGADGQSGDERQRAAIHLHAPGAPCAPTPIRVTGAGRGVGKTTLAERLIAGLADRGWRVAAIKHSHHALPPDREGSDSDRLARAGAGSTLYVAAGGVVERSAVEPPVTALLERLTDYQFVVVEGYRDVPLGAKLHLRGTPPATVTAIGAAGEEQARVGADDLDPLLELAERWHNGAAGSK